MCLALTCDAYLSQLMSTRHEVVIQEWERVESSPPRGTGAEAALNTSQSTPDRPYQPPSDVTRSSDVTQLDAKVLKYLR